MSAVDHLSDLQFKFTAAQGPQDADMTAPRKVHQVDALDSEGSRVGWITWGAHNGRVNSVNVDPDRRRQGIATRMWHEAHTNAEQSGLTHPIHSDGDDQLPDGKAWARTVQ